jgi:hypothetical protein
VSRPRGQWHIVAGLGDTNIGAPYEFVEECQEVFDECVERSLTRLPCRLG